MKLKGKICHNIKTITINYRAFKIVAALVIIFRVSIGIDSFHKNLISNLWKKG